MIRLSTQVVQPEWIDYNGHMNVAYYTMAFDLAMDDMLTDYLGIDADFIKHQKVGPFALQSNYTYQAELHLGEEFYGSGRVLDYNQKSIHLFATLHRKRDDALSATWEGISLNVDHTTRRSADFSDAIQAKIESLYNQTKSDPIPDQVGQPLGIRRRSS